MPTWSTAWLVLAVILPARPAAAVEACAIMEAPGSDKTLAASVASLLEQHGVRTRSERCGTNRAWFLVDDSADPASFTLTIRDGEGKEARRLVLRDEKAVAVAVSLVESFVLGEDADLLSRPGTHAIDDRLGTETASDPHNFEQAIRPNTKIIYGERIGQLSLLAGFLFGSDSSTWFGGQIDGCARIFGSCIGVRGRFAQDDRGGGVSSDLVRTQWAGFAFAGVPFNGETWQLLPAVGLGVSYTRATMLPVPFRRSVSDYDLTGQLSLDFALFLSTSWAFRVDVAGELGSALSHASRQRSDRLNAILDSLVPEPPGSSAWFSLGLEYRR